MIGLYRLRTKRGLSNWIGGFMKEPLVVVGFLGEGHQNYPVPLFLLGDDVLDVSAERRPNHFHVIRHLTLNLLSNLLATKGIISEALHRDPPRSAGDRVPS